MVKIPSQVSQLLVPEPLFVIHFDVKNEVGDLGFSKVEIRAAITNSQKG